MTSFVNKIKKIFSFAISIFADKNRNLIDEKEKSREANLNKLRGFIRDRKRIANNDVEELLGVSDATAERYLNELENEGLLQQIGSIGQGVFYKVK